MNDIRIETLITVLDRYARRNLSDYRYEHSYRVASYAEELARRYGYGHRLQRLCYLAGKKSILNAVRYHTSASAKFDALGRIIYIADKIEPGRKNCDYLREKVKTLTLDELFLEVLKEVIGFVESKGKRVQSCTYRTYRFFKKRTGYL